MDKGDLELNYDTQQGMYYVYQDVELKPGESKRLFVEIEDIWVIDEKEINSLKTQSLKFYTALKDTPYAERAGFLVKKIEKTLSEILTRQGNAVMVNPEEHISVYRENAKILDAVKEDLVEIERLVASRALRISPFFTWWIIVIIVIFLGILSLFFFLVWQKKLKQLNVSADEIKIKEEKKPLHTRDEDDGIDGPHHF